LFKNIYVHFFSSVFRGSMEEYGEFDGRVGEVRIRGNNMLSPELA
jgi:hypothetical protein